MDPVRYLRTFDIKFNFWTMGRGELEIDRVPCFLGTDGQEKSSERFIRTLKQYDGDHATQNPGNLVRMVIAQLMYEDLSRVLSSMGRTLDKIELSLHENIVLQNFMPIWREQLGRWRNTLFHQTAAFRLLPKTFATKDTVNSGHMEARRKLLIHWC